jgi:hypothetical protein
MRIGPGSVIDFERAQDGRVAKIMAMTRGER